LGGGGVKTHLSGSGQRRVRITTEGHREVDHEKKKNKYEEQEACFIWDNNAYYSQRG